MSIQVNIDDSFDGIVMKNTLEKDEILNQLKNTFIIYWGSDKHEKNDGVIFNSPQAIKNTLDKENVILTLTRSKVKCPRRIKPGKKTEFPIIGRKYEHRGGTDIQVIDSLDEYHRCDRDYFLQYIEIMEELRIHVMDLEIFYIEEKYPKKEIAQEEMVIRTRAFGWELRETDLSSKDEQEKEEIFKLAQRAIYALNLDFGVANIGKTMKGNYVVLDVDAVPKWMSLSCRQAYINQFRKTILKYENLMNTKKNITIGADVECLIRNKETGSLLFASDFLSQNSSYGLDNRSIESGKKYFPLMEIRPNYSSNPLEVAESIESIIAGLYQELHYKNVGLYAGSMPVYNYWIGGHIHFGTKPNGKLVRALDNYLALPLMMIEKSDRARQRKKTYGVLGNYRIKSHGGFEYCSLSSWIVSPQIATGVLCLAKIIIQEYFHLTEEFLRDYSDLRAYYLANKIYFKEKIPKIIQYIQKTQTYQLYQSSVEPLLQHILMLQEWEEEKDIKEVWGLTSSNQKYELLSRCFIPKKKRKEWKIRLGQKIPIQVNDEIIEVEIGPKDDLTAEKNGYVSFSYDICKKLGITEKDHMNIWFDPKHNTYRIGPILGIFAYREDHSLGPFGLQTTYFRKMIKLSQYKGILTYVFTIWDVNWKNNSVEGYTYDFNEEEWVKKTFPIPDVIYDRGDVVTEQNYGQYAIDYLEHVKKNNIKFINSIECIEMTNDKWKTYLLLSRNERTQGYQPATWEYDRAERLMECIERYGHVFMKLKDGSRSKGIFSIEKTGDDYIICYKNIYGYNMQLKTKKNHLIRLIDDKIKEGGFHRTDYIIQQAVTKVTYNGRSFEVRVVMQKNSQGNWFRTCMVARVIDSDENFLDGWNEKNIQISKVLAECFKEDAEEIANRIRNMAKRVVAVIDDYEIQAGEIAIDFAIDIHGNIYIIEMNSKPDNLLARIGAFKMRNLAIYRIIEYAKFLVFREMQ